MIHRCRCNAFVSASFPATTANAALMREAQQEVPGWDGQDLEGREPRGAAGFSRPSTSSPAKETYRGTCRDWTVSAVIVLLTSDLAAPDVGPALYALNGFGDRLAPPRQPGTRGTERPAVDLLRSGDDTDPHACVGRSSSPPHS